MANTFNLGNGNWAQKTEKLLAYNAENDNYKPLPFDFDRASTATRVNKQGLIETVGIDEPRIDFSNDSKGALLLEPSRTNLVTYSEDFSQWSITGATVTSNTTTSPDGTQNADEIDVSSDNDRLSTNGGSFTSGDTYTGSVYLKGSGTISVNVGTSSGGGVENEKSVTLTDEWVRHKVTYTAPSTTGNWRLMIIRRSTDTSTSAQLWGAQLEEGSYATSYIPTQGSAVTRSAESCSQTPPDGVIGQTEGTIYFESEINGLQGGDMRFQLSDGSTNNWIFISSGEATGIGVKCRAYINNGNVNQFNAYSEYLSAGKHKYAFAYKQNDIALYVDGVQVSLDTSATIPSCDEITLSGSTPTNVNASHFLSYKDIKLYKTRLSNSELQALTT